ncbi:hypothetical protein IF1G_11377 [Cordyceps javanica]|uniref:Uncharacterized protein n=1 Tax=Cordyceps javanica TaxID=43265 RepID=A0A545VI98_9HYPO|nr:hypothetical protein IF1G_11377 [Cordyceps javanica]TQW01451.1 hypothetical protein IF2G_11033 [Cordyceps javanica]
MEQQTRPQISYISIMVQVRETINLGSHGGETREGLLAVGNKVGQYILTIGTVSRYKYGNPSNTTAWLWQLDTEPVKAFSSWKMLLCLDSERVSHTGDCFRGGKRATIKGLFQTEAPSCKNHSLNLFHLSYTYLIPIFCAATQKEL